MSSRLGRAGIGAVDRRRRGHDHVGPPWRRAASRTSMVPVALAWWLAMGSASERGTDGRAARWTTASAPVEHPVEERRRRGSTPRRARRRRRRPGSAGDPVERSSRATTWSTKSWPASARHRLAPMKPAPPVTTTFTVGAWTRSVSRRLDVAVPRSRFRVSST